MRSTAESQKTKAEKTKTECAYLVDKTGEGAWTVRKVDPFSPGAVLAQHRVTLAGCDCEGFGRSQDLRCRHTDMVRTSPTVVDRRTARRAAAEVISMWGPLFDRLIFDDYVEAAPGDGDPFAAPGEGDIRAVRLAAHGRPVSCGGKEYRKLFCVRRRMQVIVDIE